MTERKKKHTSRVDDSRATGSSGRKKDEVKKGRPSSPKYKGETSSERKEGKKEGQEKKASSQRSQRGKSTGRKSTREKYSEGKEGKEREIVPFQKHERGRPAGRNIREDRRKGGSTPFYKSKARKPTGKTKRTDGDEREGIRLNKYIANAGICSRREADTLILSGAVSVNGKVVTELGTKVNPSDKIKVGGQSLSLEKKVYVLLNKPKDYITTTDDPQKRRTVIQLVRSAARERLYPVGRLDRNTTGVLLMTNDGDLSKKLTHPKYGVKKIYHVVTDKNVKKADLLKLVQGIEIDDGLVKADAATYVAEGKDKKQIGVELHSGKYRVVRRMFEALGYEVQKLDRVYFAGLTKKNLERGKWRYLTPQEIMQLKKDLHVH